MKTNQCESIAAARRFSGMQHRRPAKHVFKPASMYWTESDSRFEAIVESSDDAIISKTLTGIITSWNTGAETIFGYTAQEMIGQSMLRLFPIERQEEEAIILERIMAGEKIDHFETVRMRKDGRLIDVSVTISPVRDDQGHIIGASKIARDITEKNRLEASAEQFQAVITCSDDAIITKSLDGRINSWNKAAQAMFGYSAQEMIGESMLRLFPPERVDEENFILGKILKGEKVDHFETVRVCKDGSRITISATISPIRDRHGRIIGASKIARDITQLRRQQAQLEHLAHFDSLTDLPNRRLMTDRLCQSMALCKRNGQELAVLYLDLDGFKQVNDTHGHDVGDALLIALSRRISGKLRDTDTLARIGGDEFVAVLVDVGQGERLKRVIKRILRACSEPVQIDGKRLEVSASIGLTTYPHDDVDEDQLLRHADLAMYEAKQSGKNRYHTFDAFRDAEGKSRFLYVRRLAQALQQDELLLHYQPKVNMRTGAVVGAEALIRWQHPERGLLPPNLFLPMIEGHPLNDELGLWVISQALAQMAVWRAQGIRLPVSVNLAPNQLQDSHFPIMLANLLARYPEMDPADLELELVETSAMRDIDATSRVMQACSKLGVQFAIDDFGTGYSSLTYLKRLPARLLKIDQSFVRDMLCDQEDLAIVKGVIGLAEAFQRKVIAEGVETIEHAEKLMEMGCQLAQGYGISRPMAGSEMPAWMQSWQHQPQWVCPQWDD